MVASGQISNSSKLLCMRSLPAYMKRIKLPEDQWSCQRSPDGYMAKMWTTRVAQMATWPRCGQPEWPRWLHAQDVDNQSGPDGYMAKMETTRVAQMATWSRCGQPEWPRWLHGQDGDYQSGQDGYMAKMETTRVALMATWPRWRLPE